MYKAFMFVQAAIEVSLTPDFIKDIHRLAAKACKPFVSFHGWGDITYIDIGAGTFKDSASGYIRMGADTISRLGLLEMQRDFADIEKDRSLTVVYPRQIRGSYTLEMETLISQYEMDVQAKDVFAKLKAIVLFIQQAERLHPFNDGNLRTFGTLLLNRELVCHGSSPTLLKDPNRLMAIA